MTVATTTQLRNTPLATHHETESAWEATGNSRPATRSLTALPSPSNARAEKLRRTEIIGRIAARNLPTQGGTGAAESVGMWIEFMVEDTADIHADDLDTVAREGIRKWRFRPTAADFHELAEPLRDHRRAIARIDETRAVIAARGPAPRALPAPTPAKSDLEALASFGYTWDEQGNAVRIKPAERRRSEPFTMPTQADLQSIADELDRMPLRERMTMTADDCAALGMKATHA